MIYIEVVDTTPPEWTTAITDQYIDYGSYFEYHLTASDLSGIDYWQINDTSNFDISGSGWISSRDILEPGVYGLEVTVYDSYGNSRSATFTVYVIAATSMTTTITSTTTITTTTTTSTTITITTTTYTTGEATTTTTTTTTATTSTQPSSLTPVVPPDTSAIMFLIVGLGLGAGITIIIIIVILRKRGGSG